MGSRGPAPIPTPTLRLRGSWLADTRQDEPESPVESPPRPAWLAGEAKTEWDRIVPILLSRRTLSDGDLALLAAYCHAWGEFVWAVKKIKSLGSKRVESNIDNPRVILKNAFDRLHKCAQQFGLSPSSKSRLRAESDTRATSDKSRFFADAG